MVIAPFLRGSLIFIFINSMHNTFDVTFTLALNYFSMRRIKIYILSRKQKNKKRVYKQIDGNGRLKGCTVRIKCLI